MTSDLETITTKLGKSYKKYKEYLQIKDKLKEDFFKEASSLLFTGTKQEWIKVRNEDEAYEEANKRFPDYKVVDVQGSSMRFLLTLEEIADFSPYEFVNPKDKQVYKRIRQEGSIWLDDEAIMDENPNLYQQITRPRTGRELIPLDELPDDILPEVQKYIYPGKPIMKLAAPRKATKDELEDISRSQIDAK